MSFNEWITEVLGEDMPENNLYHWLKKAWNARGAADAEIAEARTEPFSINPANFILEEIQALDSKPTETLGGESMLLGLTENPPRQSD